MLPHYQTRELEYDNNVKKRIARMLKSKYENEVVISHELLDPIAQQNYDAFEKLIYLVYGLLQEALMNIVTVGNVNRRDTDMRTSHPIFSIGTPVRNTSGRVPSYSSPDVGLMPSSKRMRGGAMDDTTASIDHIEGHIDHALAQNRDAILKSLGGASSYTKKMNQVLRLGVELRNAASKLSAYLNSLSQDQVVRIETLINDILSSLFPGIKLSVQNEYDQAKQSGLSARPEIKATKEITDKVDSAVISQFRKISDVLQTYNPISTTVKAPTVNHAQSSIPGMDSAYALDRGNFMGKYV
jgi:hypothetical protein